MIDLDNLWEDDGNIQTLASKHWQLSISLKANFTSGIVSTYTYCSDQSGGSKSLVGMKDCLAFSAGRKRKILTHQFLARKYPLPMKTNVKFCFDKQTRHNSLLTSD